MDKEKIATLAYMLTGLRRHEWSQIKIAVEKVFDSAASKLVLDDTESIQRNIMLEMGLFKCSQQSESLTDESGSHDPHIEHGHNHT